MSKGVQNNNREGFDKNRLVKIYDDVFVYNA